VGETFVSNNGHQFINKCNEILFCFRVGDLGDGTYTLTAKGRSPVIFDESQKLEYVHKGYSIFIQTDKAIYRPGKTCF